jgi:hypothetical protein
MTTNNRQMQAKHPEHSTNTTPTNTPRRVRPGGQSAEKTSIVPRLTLSKAEAAASLGVSVDFLESHVMPDLRVIRKGRLVLIPVRELERWVDLNAASLWGQAS